jgi:hypothetical protein
VYLTPRGPPQYPFDYEDLTSAAERILLRSLF